MIKFRIQSFRTFEDNEIEFESNTILIGANDSGKSNVRKALSYFCDRQYLYDINEDKSLFDTKNDKVKVSYYLNEQEQVEIESFISELADIEMEVKPKDPIREIARIEENYFIIDENNVEYLIDAKRFDRFLPKLDFIDIDYDNFTIEELTKKLSNIMGRRNELERKLNNYIKKYWDNDYESSVTVESSIQAFGENKIRVRLANRGSGFQSFIRYLLRILLIVFTNMDKKLKKIIFIEEPERTLHPRVQKSIYLFLKEISDENNDTYFIISTHSPFMINSYSKTFLLKKCEYGKSHVYDTPQKDNWLELRLALGISPRDSFVLGKVTVLVEGLSEKIFIPKLLEKYKDINVEDINFIDCNGASNMPSILKYIYNISNQKIIALLDGDNEGDQTNESIKKIIEGDSLLPNGKKVLKDTVFTVTLGTKESRSKDIAFEDIFEMELIIEGVRNIYKDIDASKLNQYATENNLTSVSAGVLIGKYLTSINQIKNYKSLDKIGINAFIAEKTTKFPEKLESLATKISELCKE